MIGQLDAQRLPRVETLTLRLCGIAASRLRGMSLMLMELISPSYLMALEFASILSRSSRASNSFSSVVETLK